MFWQRKMLWIFACGMTLFFFFETKLHSNISLEIPGFVGFFNNSNAGGYGHGGVAVFVKSWLADYVSYLDSNADSVILLRLSLLGNMTLCGCYIPPRNTAYFTDQAFVVIESIIQESKDNGLILMGDFNSRLGDLNDILPTGSPYYYMPNCDVQCNANGRIMKSVLRRYQCYPLNHLCLANGKSFPGDFTFARQGYRSQIDFVIVSSNMADNIVRFHCLPPPAAFSTDHKALSFEICTNPAVNLLYLLNRAKDIQTHFCRSSARHVMLSTVDFGQYGSSLGEFASRVLADASFLSNTDQFVNDLEFRLCDEYLSRFSTVSAVRQMQGYHLTGHLRNSEGSQLLQMAAGDAKKFWKIIDWQGKRCKRGSNFSENDKMTFVEYFANLLYDPSIVSDASLTIAEDYGLYVGVTDDLFSPGEVSDAVSLINPNKARGFDRVQCGIARFLPDNFIVLLTVLFNVIFASGWYPDAWKLSRLVVLPKKGRMSPENCRGISCISLLPKIFDYVIDARLRLWWTPSPCQTGFRKGRSCLEQILTLRILAIIAQKVKKKLFLCFVDLLKAFDTISRFKLMNRLKKFGIGSRMLTLLCNLYHETMCIPEIEGWSERAVKSNIGIRQGAPSSPHLFNCFVDQVFNLIHAVGPDGFLNDLHCLLHADDACILATSREMLLRKFNIFVNFCSSNDLHINYQKTKFLCIGGNFEDRLPIPIGDQFVGYTNIFWYLGSPIHDSGKPIDAIKVFTEHRMSVLHKFICFLDVYRSYPLKVKERILDVCLFGSILYSCESWIRCDIAPLRNIYMHSLKKMIEVRKSTPNVMVLVEVNRPPLENLLLKRRKSFAGKLSALPYDAPINQSIRIAEEHGLTDILGIRQNQIVEEPSVVISNAAEHHTKMVTYRCVNPNYCRDSIYDSGLPEEGRIIVSRYRLLSHNLNVETGRWANVARSDRLCQCGEEPESMQHFFLSCVRWISMRARFQVKCSTLAELFHGSRYLDYIAAMHRCRF